MAKKNSWAFAECKEKRDGRVSSHLQVLSSPQWWGGHRYGWHWAVTRPCFQTLQMRAAVYGALRSPACTLPAPCLHLACWGCVWRSWVHQPAVRPTVLFTMGDKKRDKAEKEKENPPARSPKSQPAAVGRAGDLPGAPAAGAPASRGPSLPALQPSTSHLPPHSSERRDVSSAGER